MAFADPQSITISGTAHSLPRVSTGTDTSTYRKDDSTVVLSAAHQYGKRARRVVKVNFKKVAPDPFLANTNIEYSMAVSLVIDVPKVGFTIAEQKAVVDGFITKLSASTGLLITQTLGGES